MSQPEPQAFTLAEALAAANQEWRKEWYLVEEAVAMVLLPPVRPALRGWEALTTMKGKL